MNRLFLFLLFQSYFVLIFSKVSTCPEGMVQSLSDNTTCFLFVAQKQSFLIAEEYCIQQNGHLTSIHNAFDNALIREEAQKNFTDSTTGDFWIGLNDLITAGTWSWIDGTVMNFVDWDKGQPNNISGNDCGAVNLQGGRWSSEDCDGNKPFVCLIKVIQSTPTPKTTTTNVVATTTKHVAVCPNSWTYNNDSGFCYTVLGIPAIWSDAEQNCYDRGGHLASIHSINENIFVTNLIPFDPDDQHCDERNFAWIGLYTVTFQDRWIWTDDSRFNFSNWAPGHPFHKDAGFCGLIWNGPSCGAPSQTWADDGCEDSLRFFVCKRLPT